MLQGELNLPPKPRGARTETNAEILRQVIRDLASIYDLELTAIDGYRVFRYAGADPPSWGYCLEAARVEDSVDDLILFYEDNKVHDRDCLGWIPQSDIYTVREARSNDVSYVGPSEDVVRALLEIFRDIFEFAWQNKWTYEKRMEFYQSIPFEKLSSIASVRAFRRTLFSDPVFEGFDWNFPGVEEIEESI